MTYDLLAFAAHGLLDLPWWGYLVITLVLTHITIAAVTIFLHRAQAHRALDLHPIASHFFRFWLWLTTGMVTREWVAIHRKHHAKVETVDDPHSPQTRGIKTVLLRGTELYRAESKNQETLARYGHGVPDDWVERHVYSRHTSLGISLMLAIDLVLFGPIGLTIWAVQMLWIPITAAGIINGIGHYWGYRNFACADTSTNIVPWGIVIGGEELHNNHHAYGTSAKLSSQWYEFDIGWLYIRTLAAVGLAKVRKVAPKVKFAGAKPVPDLGTLHAVLTHRYHVATSYARTLKTACATELAHLKSRAESLDLPSPRRMKRFLLADPASLTDADRVHLTTALARSKPIATIYSMRQELAALWERSTESSEQLLARLQDWCHRAEASGIAPLAAFSHQLRRYA
ncbi:MAG: fatty acid desaturase [Burkholderiales bacterium]|nr:fatty acid desaturase [Burkholderiales bacterium]